MAEQWPSPYILTGHHRSIRPHRGPPRRRREPRRPLLGLSALLVFGLLATFFAWVTAEPLWLAVGHGSPGTATVIRCTGHGLDQRCQVRFRAGQPGRCPTAPKTAACDAPDGDGFTVTRVYLVGAPAAGLRGGATVTARMVSPRGRLAYAGTGAGLALRWALGLALTLLCGLVTALATGAHRLPVRRNRWYALLVSLTGPVVLLVAMLAITR